MRWWWWWWWWWCGAQVYWTLLNDYFSSTICTIRLNITYTTYSLTGLSPILTGSGTLDAADGIVIMVPPSVPDPRNTFSGPNDFTIGPDMYTIRLKQQANAVAAPGAMMGIFAAVCVVFCLCGVVMINGLPACLGGSTCLAVCCCFALLRDGNT
jgi:hypothetical protein